MSKKPRKMLNAAINTDSTMFDNLASRDSMARQPRLKERYVKHLKISHSAEIRESYSFGEQIGQGSYGTVISVLDKQTEKDWAMKIVTKSAVGNKLDTLHREIQILKMVDHPHIIYLDRVYESTKKIYLIMERCYGELSKMFKARRQFSEMDTRKVIRDLASAVAYLHKNDIVHRDLKMENILIAKNPDDINDKLFIKVSDFGLSVIKQGSGYEDMLHDFCGTLVYMAPEIITTHSYSQQCDVWAIGVIMYALLNGRYPFFSIHEQELATMICNDQPPSSGFCVNSSANNLVKKMLTKNPALRITAAEVILHPWITGKPMVRGAESVGNVLEMMRLWRSEMLLPVEDESDWVSSSVVHASQQRRRSSNSSYYSEAESDFEESDVGYATASGTRRQSMQLPVKNIRFNRATIESGGGNGMSVVGMGTSTGRRSNPAVGFQERISRRGSAAFAPIPTNSSRPVNIGSRYVVRPPPLQRPQTPDKRGKSFRK